MPVAVQTYKMVPAVYEENASQSKLLMHNPMPVFQKKNIAARQINNRRTAFSSMGLAIPFQPSMWDEKSIHSVWNNGIEMVKARMKGRYSKECSNTILARLEKLFTKLNYNTHRKGLAIILTPDEEKINYFSFPVKPVAFLSKNISMLDLAANMQQEAAFYYFVLNEKSLSLYDYNNKQLRKVYENYNVTCPVTLFRNAANTIELLNSKYEKPVFITGSPNRVEEFCNSTAYSKRFFTLLYHASPFSTEIIQSLINEIAGHWTYWQSKFVKTKILIAKEANSVIAHLEAVLKALGNCADGVLMVDKQLKNQLQKSGIKGGAFQWADELMHQLEKFLLRGNRVEITESGLLKDMGGIVLLKENNKHQPTYRHCTSGGSLY